MSTKDLYKEIAKKTGKKTHMSIDRKADNQLCYTHKMEMQ